MAALPPWEQEQGWYAVAREVMAEWPPHRAQARDRQVHEFVGRCKAIWRDRSHPARASPAVWLAERARRYIASPEATKDDRQYCCKLSTWCRDRWGDDDEAWGYVQQTAATAVTDEYLERVRNIRR